MTTRERLTLDLVSLRGNVSAILWWVADSALWCPAPRGYHSTPVRPPRTLLWNVPPTAHMACSHYPIRWTTFLLKNILKYIQLKFHFTFRVQHSSLPQPVTDLPPRTEQHSIECMSHSVYSISFDGPLGCFHLSFHYSLTRILVCKNGCLRPCFHYGASW